MPWPSLHGIFAFIGACNAYVWWAQTSTFYAMLTFLFGNLAAIILNRHRLHTLGGLLLYGLVPTIGIACDVYILVQSFFIELWAQPWATGKSVVVFDVACALLAASFVLARKKSPAPADS